MATRMSDQKVVPSDQGVRDLIDTTLDRNVVIVAGAGAGKTTAIVSRMIALVASGITDTGSVAAITFTRKAAGELRNRFISALHKAIQDEDPGTDRHENLRKALEDSDQAFAGTIHSFCGQLLRERSFAVGLQPDFVEIDEREEAILRKHVWNEFLHQQQLADNANFKAVQNLQVGIDRLFQFFSDANEFRDMTLKPAEAIEPDLGLAVAMLKEFVSTLENAAPQSFDFGKDPLMQALLKARHYLENRSLTTTTDQVDFLKIFEAVRYQKITPAWWGDPALAERLKKGEYKEFRDNIVKPALARWGEFVYATILPFINDAVEFYAEWRRRDGLVSFDDLLFYATKLLRENSEARQYFAVRYKHLFVDEFQDTDPIQAELIFLLAAEDPDSKDWRTVTPRAGALCIVGDEKQAIYRFRRADVETFRFATQRIQDTGGILLELTTSFRSLGNLCQWYNDSFSKILSHDDDRYQARYLPLEKFRSDGIDPFCVRKLSIPKVYRNNPGEIAEIEATRVAEFIYAALNGKSEVNSPEADAPLAQQASAGDFMILTRKNANLAIYSRALQRFGIPYDIVGGAPLGDSIELRDLVHLLRSVYEPENTLWVLSYLRGNLNGFSDPELYEFVRHGGRLTIYPSIPDSLDKELKGRLTRAFERLHLYRRWLTEYPPLSAIEQIIEDLGLLPFSASMDNGSGRAGSLLRVLDLVRQWEQRGLSWGEILSELIGLIDDPWSNLYESTLEAGRQDVVRLMNVHQSKGLQARVVILADTYNPIKSRIKRHVSRMSDPPYVSIKVTEPKANYDLVISQPPSWEDDEAEEARFEEGEENRLRYVAATRAQNLLVVSQYAHVKDKGQWYPFYSGLTRIPELEYEPLAPPSRKAVSTPKLAEVVASRTSAIALAKQPTYRLITVTEEDEETLKIDVPTGFGSDYGTAVHHLLELSVKGNLPSNLEAYIHAIGANYPMARGQESRLAAAVDRFQQSELSVELATASHVFTETPVGMADSTGSELTRGVIDLIYRLEDGWKIVDYKSVVSESAEDSSRIVQRYRDQLLAYSDFWHRATGENVVECGIWLTETGEFLPVDIPGVIDAETVSVV